MSGPWTLNCCISSFVWAQTLNPGPLSTHPKLALNPSCAEAQAPKCAPGDILYSSRSDAVVVFRFLRAAWKTGYLTALTTCTPSSGLSGALGSCQRRKANTKKSCSSDTDYNKHMHTQAHVKLSNLSLILAPSSVGLVWKYQTRGTTSLHTCFRPFVLSEI